VLGSCDARTNWRLAEVGRQLEAEHGREHSDVGVVTLVQFVAEVVADLDLRRHARDAPPRDAAERDQPLAGIEAPATVVELLVPVSLLVEDDYVEVDLASTRITDDEARRKPRRRLRRVLEAQWGECETCVAEGVA
jgi:hypothetical protein